MKKDKEGLVQTFFFLGGGVSCENRGCFKKSPMIWWFVEGGVLVTSSGSLQMYFWNGLVIKDKVFYSPEN